MKNLFYTLLASTFISSASFAMDFSQILPADLIVHMSGFLEPQDARALAHTNPQTLRLRPRIKAKQIPNRYKAIKKDYAKSILSLRVPGWRLAEKMPGLMKTISDHWYLEGRMQKDPFIRFCYLFAAGRAGNAYAIEEAGQLLIASVPERSETDEQTGDGELVIIPSSVTLQQLINTVPGFNENQKWDLTQIKDELIDDPIVRLAYQNTQNRNSKHIELIEALMANSYTVDIAKNLFNAMIEENLAMLKSEFDHLEPLAHEDNLEAQAVLLIIDRALKVYEFDAISELLWSFEQTMIRFADVDPQDEQSTFNARSRARVGNFKQCAPGLIDFLREKLLTIKKPDITERIVVNSKLSQVAVYWKHLADLYSKADRFSDKEKALSNILGTKSVPATFRAVSHSLLEAHTPTSEKDENKLKDVVDAAKHHQFAACLLDSSESCKNLRDTLNPTGTIRDFLSAGAGEDLAKQKEATELFQKWNPMTAFTLQLNILRDPKNLDVLRSADYIYADDIGNYAKSDAFEKITNILEQGNLEETE